MKLTTKNLKILIEEVIKEFKMPDNMTHFDIEPEPEISSGLASVEIPEPDMQAAQEEVYRAMSKPLGARK